MAQSSLCPPSVLLAGVQTDSTGELALEHRALGREHQKKRGKKREYLQCGWEGAKETFWPPLQFFWSPNLLLGRRNTNNPIQK